jgi:hypothetical protein
MKGPFIYIYLIFLMQFLWGLGLQEDEAECYDVYGLDGELLEMVPKPVLAVLFLYPLTTQVFFFFPFLQFFILFLNSKACGWQSLFNLIYLSVLCFVAHYESILVS